MTKPFRFFAPGFLILACAPVAVLLLVSLSGVFSPGLWPRTWSARSWEIIMAEGSSLGGVMASSLAYSLATVFLGIAAAWPASRYLAFHGTKSTGFLLPLLILPAFFPPLSWLFGLQRVMLTLGMSDTFAGVVLGLSVLTYPYILLSLVSGYEVLDRRLLEASENLGASRMQTFFWVEAPLLLPSLGAGALVSFLVAWSDYLVVFQLGGGRVASYAGYLYPFVFSDERSLGSALLLLFLLIPGIMIWIIFFKLNRFKKQLSTHKGGFHV